MAQAGFFLKVPSVGPVLHSDLTLGNAFVAKEGTVRPKHVAIFLVKKFNLVEVARDVISAVVELERLPSVLRDIHSATTTDGPHLFGVAPPKVNDAVPVRSMGKLHQAHSDLCQKIITHISRDTAREARTRETLPASLDLNALKLRRFLIEVELGP